MEPQDFLKRFKSNAPISTTSFDRAELEGWARDFRVGLSAQHETLAAQFGQALELAGGKFYQARDQEAAAATALQIAQAHEAQSVVAWNHPLLAVTLAALQGAGISVTRSEVRDGNTREGIRQASARAEIGLTACDYAIAETGTLLLIGNAQQGRLTSLLPITHIALIAPDQLAPTLANAFRLLRLARLSSTDGRLPSNISLHTGPSKTADIEQTLTKGVHGPKEVHIILVANP